MTKPLLRRNPHMPRSSTRSNRKGVRGFHEDSSSRQLDCTKIAGESVYHRRSQHLGPALLPSGILPPVGGEGSPPLPPAVHGAQCDARGTSQWPTHRPLRVVAIECQQTTVCEG